MGERILSSFFQSVTARTAGFNSSDLTKFTENDLLIMILLMLIGLGYFGKKIAEKLAEYHEDVMAVDRDEEFRWHGLIRQDLPHVGHGDCSKTDTRGDVRMQKKAEADARGDVRMQKKRKWTPAVTSSAGIADK